MLAEEEDNSELTTYDIFTVIIDSLQKRSVTKKQEIKAETLRENPEE